MKKLISRTPWCVIYNLLIVYVVYMICRIEFIVENWSIFGADLTWGLAWSVFKGGLRFDTVAIIYTNLLYIAIVLLPLHYKERRWIHVVAKWAYLIPNTFAILANLIDSVYFPFTLRRSTMSVFAEFADNTNIWGVIGVECVNHWYLVLLAIALVTLLYCAYVNYTAPDIEHNIKRYYIRQSIIFVAAIPLIIMGIRGNNILHINRAIYTTLANEYVKKPEQTGMVVNTPFSFIRSSKRAALQIPAFYATINEAEGIYSPVHHAGDSLVTRNKNIVIVLVESLSEEFLDYLNRFGDKASSHQNTPFIDSLLSVSLYYEQSFANGYSSIDVIPSIHSSLPKMYYSYITSQYALDEMPGLSKELLGRGYSSAFFHGAENSSLGLKGSALSTGIDEYIGMDDYIKDNRFGGKADFDGLWGIWDDKFLQFVCDNISNMPQPFIATVFTLNSHHPFTIPNDFERVIPDHDPQHPIKRCITYADYSLREFFVNASRQDWFHNTIFVITADHCFPSIVDNRYRSAVGQYRIPLLFFDPSGELPRGVHPGIAQQIDIMPTLLTYLGYDQPYVAYGKDLFNTAAEDTWAIQYQEVPQLIKGDYLIQMQDYKLSGVYRYKTDFTLNNNLLATGDYDQAYVQQMEQQLKAILQSADTRLRDNTLRKIDIE